MKSMTRAAITLAILIGPAVALAAQGSPASSPKQAEITAVRPAAIEKGDQSISLAIDLNAPLFVIDPTGQLEAAHIYPGASFTVTYQYFVEHGLAIGGSLAASFNQSFGGNNFIVTPLAFRTAYTWILGGSFDLSLGAEAGAYLMFYRDQVIGDPFLKATAGFDWRAANAWSVGLATSYWFTPEIHFADPTTTRYGNSLDVGIQATYHL